MEIRGAQVSIVFNQMNVDSIEVASGIFIGVNYAMGWSSHGKVNQGFGGLSQSEAKDMINLVYDQDLLDAPIMDQKSFTVHHTADSASSSEVRFDSINAHTLNSNSTVTIGENEQTGWSAHRKTNYGNAKAHGLNLMGHMTNVVEDNDFVDVPIVHEQSVDR